MMRSSPNRGDKLTLATEIAVLGIFDDGFADQNVTGFVLIAEVPKRRPGADIRPRECDGYNGSAVGVLHDSVVDGDRGCRPKSLGVKATPASSG
jgi:hypothetical protein